MALQDSSDSKESVSTSAADGALCCRLGQGSTTQLVDWFLGSCLGGESKESQWDGENVVLIICM